MPIIETNMKNIQENKNMKMTCDSLTLYIIKGSLLKERNQKVLNAREKKNYLISKTRTVSTLRRGWGWGKKKFKKWK